MTGRHPTGLPGIDGLRPVRDNDAVGLCALIGGVYSEYPGCVLEPEGLDADLLAAASVVARSGGAMWVVQRGAAVVACCGWKPQGAGLVELKRLYVARSARREGLGGRLVELVQGAARDFGATRIELWSDTRFTDAHRLYESRGYVRGPGTRELHDASNSVEQHFAKTL